MDAPHISASSIKQEKRNSHASFPPSVGGKEKPSSLSIGVLVPFGSSSTSVRAAAERFWGCGVNPISVLLLDAMVMVLMWKIVLDLSSGIAFYNAIKSGLGSAS
jgi:hypothetical protein